MCLPRFIDVPEISNLEFEALAVRSARCSARPRKREEPCAVLVPHYPATDVQRGCGKSFAFRTRFPRRVKRRSQVAAILCSSAIVGVGMLDGSLNSPRMLSVRHDSEPANTIDVRNRLPQSRSGHGKSDHLVDPGNGLTTFRALYRLHRGCRPIASRLAGNAAVFPIRRLFLVQRVAPNSRDWKSKTKRLETGDPAQALWVRS